MASLFSAEVQVTREIARLDHISEATRKRLLPTVSDIAEKIADRARSTAPVESGKYLKSIRTKVKADASEVKGRVIAGGRGSGAAQANLLEYGTKAHAITARNMKRLRFQLPTVGVIYARTVTNPGMRAQHILTGALDAYRTEAQTRITAAIEAAVKE
jgi:HK97 gp10 family phage protein